MIIILECLIRPTYCTTVTVTLYIGKITKTNKKNSVWYYFALEIIAFYRTVLLNSDLLRHCVFVNKSEEKEVRKFIRYLFKEHEYSACLSYNL